jgi:hypothetical protein
VTGLESLVSEYTGPSGPRLAVDDADEGWGPEGWLRLSLLHRDSVLGDVLISRLPDERDVAGIGSLESPREEGRDCISPD